MNIQNSSLSWKKKKLSEKYPLYSIANEAEKWTDIRKDLYGFQIYFKKLYISVEVGMQNSGLGAALAEKHFASLPLAALPCAISATFHSVIGSLLAGVWRLRPVRK